MVRTERKKEEQEPQEGIGGERNGVSQLTLGVSVCGFERGRVSVRG